MLPRLLSTPLRAENWRTGRRSPNIGRVVLDGPNLSQELVRGALVKTLYRLGRHQASGILLVRAPAQSGASVGEMFVLRRGAVVVGEGELARRLQIARLDSLCAADRVSIEFQGGVNACPPGRQHQVPLAPWVRARVEAELDSALAEQVMRELAGMRLSIRAALAPVPVDEADRRLLSAMDKPRRLDQIWPLARTSRFRILAWLHFLRRVDALEAEGVVAETSGPHRRCIGERHQAAARLLGVGPDADRDAIKRAYRRLARSLHPDLQPHTDPDRRRHLEQRFAEVTAAYEALT